MTVGIKIKIRKPTKKEAREAIAKSVKFFLPVRDTAAGCRAQKT